MAAQLVNRQGSRVCLRSLRAVNYKTKPIITLLFVLLLATDGATSQTNSLEQQIARFNPAAIRQAANEGRTDLIPQLKQIASTSIDAQEPAMIWANAALAKLGEKTYLEKSIAELTDPKSTALYQSFCSAPRESSGELRSPLG